MLPERLRAHGVAFVEGTEFAKQTITQISNTKIKGKLYTQLSPKTDIQNQKVCTWLKRIQKAKKMVTYV